MLFPDSPFFFSPRVERPQDCPRQYRTDLAQYEADFVEPWPAKIRYAVIALLGAGGWLLIIGGALALATNFATH